MKHVIFIFYAYLCFCYGQSGFNLLSNRQKLSLSHEGETDFSPLHIMAMTGQVKTMKSFLNITEDSPGEVNEINVKTSKGNTPIHFAAEFGWINTLGFLLSRASLSAIWKVNNDNRTPLHLAAMMGNGKVVRRLSFFDQGGNNINAKDKFNNTALFYALHNIIDERRSNESM